MVTDATTGGGVRIARRYARVVALVAVASGLVASVVLLMRPQTYAATATVVLPTAASSGSVIASTTQEVADLQAVVRTKALAERVAKAVGLRPEDVAGGLSSTRVGNGGVVEVRYEGRDPATVERVAVEAGRQALAILADAQLAPYAQRLDIATQAFDDASERLRAFLERFGNIQPQDEFQRIAATLADLRERADEAEAAGDAERVAELSARIDALTARWSPLIVEWQGLNAARARAQRQLETAQLDYAIARSALEAVLADGSSVLGTRATAVPRLSTVVRGAVPIVVLATALAILLVIALEAVRAGMGAVDRPRVRAPGSGR